MIPIIILQKWKLHLLISYNTILIDQYFYHFHKSILMYPAQIHLILLSNKLYNKKRTSYKRYTLTKGIKLKFTRQLKR